MAQLTTATLDIPRLTRDCVPSPEEWLRAGPLRVGRLVARIRAIDEASQRSIAISDPEWLSIRQAARRLGVHENTIRNWIVRGTLKFARLPGSGYRRLRDQDVEALRTTMNSPFAPGLSAPLGDPQSEPSRGFYKGGGGQIKRNND